MWCDCFFRFFFRYNYLIQVSHISNPFRSFRKPINYWTVYWNRGNVRFKWFHRSFKAKEVYTILSSKTWNFIFCFISKWNNNLYGKKNSSYARRGLQRQQQRQCDNVSCLGPWTVRMLTFSWYKIGCRFYVVTRHVGRCGNRGLSLNN